ncbi:MAG: radical SAM protein [Candidatus Omnitrophota bacterium]|nr:radical SAM protein [Candidatus Omnitrophota bacterium]
MKSLKISIIKPPSNNRRIYPPLGLGYIAAFLKKEGFDVDFVDTTIIDFPFHLLKGIPRFYWKEACKIDWEKISAYFLNKTRDADVALINGSFTADIYNTARIAGILKQKNKACLTVVGGTHVSALPQETLEEFPNIDIVVMGEGEYIVRELLNALTTGKSYHGLKGIAYRNETGKIIVGERSEPIADINELPFPSRELMSMDKYRMIWEAIQIGPGPGFIGDPAAVVFSSRGCTSHCLFCASREISAGRMRLRSVENIIGEIEQLIKNYHISNVHFLDDFLTVDHERTLRICKFLKKLKMEWYCYARVDSVSEEMLREMKNSGCALVDYGLESGDQTILNNMCKGFTLEQAKKALAITRKVGLKYVASFTFGMPGESKETFRKTLRLAKTFGGMRAGIFRITPYPGSPLYRMAIKNKWLISKRWDMYDDHVVSELVYVPPGWSKDEFQKTYIAAQRQLDRHYTLSRILRSRSIFKRIPALLRSLLRHCNGKE